MSELELTPPTPLAHEAVNPTWMPAAWRRLINDRRGLAGLLASILLAHAALVFATPYHTGPDSATYVALARSLSAGQGFTAAGVAHDHYSPGFPLLLTLVVKSWPAALGAARLVILVTTWLAAGLIYQVCRRWLDHENSVLVTVLWLLNPVVIWQQVTLLSDVPFVATVFAALAAWLKWRDGVQDLGAFGRKRWLLLCAGLCFVATLQRMAGFVLGPSLAVAHIWLSWQRFEPLRRRLNRDAGDERSPRVDLDRANAVTSRNSHPVLAPRVWIPAVILSAAPLAVIAVNLAWFNGAGVISYLRLAEMRLAGVPSGAASIDEGSRGLFVWRVVRELFLVGSALIGNQNWQAGLLIGPPALLACLYVARRRLTTDLAGLVFWFAFYTALVAVWGFNSAGRLELPILPLVWMSLMLAVVTMGRMSARYVPALQFSLVALCVFALLMGPVTIVYKLALPVYESARHHGSVFVSKGIEDQRALIDESGIGHHQISVDNFYQLSLVVDERLQPVLPQHVASDVRTAYVCVSAGNSQKLVKELLERGWQIVGSRDDARFLVDPSELPAGESRLQPRLAADSESRWK